MAKRGSTTFSATKVAIARLAASLALSQMLELGKDPLRLRHYVAVQLRRNHRLQKEADEWELGGDKGSEVTSPVRG